MAIQKISRASIGDQVYQQMKDQIVNGEWKAGDRLPSENELAEQFGVSRVTVPMWEMPAPRHFCSLWFRRRLSAITAWEKSCSFGK